MTSILSTSAWIEISLRGVEKGGTLGMEPPVESGSCAILKHRLGCRWRLPTSGASPYHRVLGPWFDDETRLGSRRGDDANEIVSGHLDRSVYRLR